MKLFQLSLLVQTFQIALIQAITMKKRESPIEMMMGTKTNLLSNDDNMAKDVLCKIKESGEIEPHVYFFGPDPNEEEEDGE